MATNGMPVDLQLFRFFHQITQRYFQGICQFFADQHGGVLYFALNEADGSPMDPGHLAEFLATYTLFLPFCSQ